MLSRIQILYQNYIRNVIFNTIINFACGVFYRNRVELDSFSSSKFHLFVMNSTVAFGNLTDIYFRYCFRLRRMCCYYVSLNIETFLSHMGATRVEPKYLRKHTPAARVTRYFWKKSKTPSTDIGLGSFLKPRDMLDRSTANEFKTLQCKFLRNLRFGETERPGNASGVWHCAAEWSIHVYKYVLPYIHVCVCLY